MPRPRRSRASQLISDLAPEQAIALRTPPADPFNIGSARGDEFHGPGFVNWDLSAFKTFQMGGTRRLQLRVELYNAFNTWQWTAVNTTASFDYPTRVLTIPTVFGRLSGATQSARRIQLAARFTF